MLKSLRIFIVGGDARYLEVMKRLSATEASVTAAGYEQASDKPAGIHYQKLRHSDLSQFDAVLLPVAGTDDHGKVESAFSTEELVLTKEMLGRTPAYCTIYTGIANSYLTDIAASAGRPLVRLFEREDIAVLNAIPTAEGALQLAMKHTRRTIHGSRVTVLGFGRIGFAVACLFLQTGAIVRVGIRNPEAAARVQALGMTPVWFDQLEKEVDNAEIWINTVPAPVLHEALIGRIDKTALIIDLASKPGGTDFAAAAEKGIQAIHALGLPGKTAPETAGQLLADIICQLLLEQVKK